MDARAVWTAARRRSARTTERAAGELKAPNPPVDDVGEQTMHSDESPHIRRHEQTPDGKRIEIVYRDHRRADPDRAYASDPLHVCFHCDGELVHPLDWSEEGEKHWRIILRCPECESRREGVFDQASVESLDEQLDRAAGALLSDLKRLTHANMTDEIEFFIRALHADLIVPADF
jgi:hypothetical protein